MSTYEISKSSLLSLKSEILRKQQELVKAKANNEVKIRKINKKTPLELKNQGIERRQNNDMKEEDVNLLNQSRSILEAKSKLYDTLSSRKLNDAEKECNKRYLVRFDKKSKLYRNDISLSDSDDLLDGYSKSEDHWYSDEEDLDQDPGNIWVDYIDCLGRTRKCLQKDLEYLKLKDEELKKTVEAKRKNELNNDRYTPEKDVDHHTEDLIGEKDKGKDNINQESELLSSDMRRELLRQHWEKEEEELRSKSNIHYQDILFGEARTHGVGYYGFSKDEEERAKEQEALRKLRDETEQKQTNARKLKAMREKQLAVRIKAAKNRKRERLGLPPEEELPIIHESEIPSEEEKKQKQLKRTEEEKRDILDEARKQHIRPWDIGKEGVKQYYKMNQEEWVDKKRKERPKEFAPPCFDRKEFRTFVKTPEIEETDKSLNFTTKKQKEKLQFRKVNNQNQSLNTHKSTTSVLNMQTNSKDFEGEASANTFHYKDRQRSFAYMPKNTDFEQPNQRASIRPTSIINLCEETYFDASSLTKPRNSESKDDKRDSGVEIAPPLTFDYHQPSPSKILRIASKTTNINESIEAGLKFLRSQIEEKEKSTKRPREMYLS